MRFEPEATYQDVTQNLPHTSSQGKATAKRRKQAPSPGQLKVAAHIKNYGTPQKVEALWRSPRFRLLQDIFLEESHGDLRVSWEPNDLETSQT